MAIEKQIQYLGCISLTIDRKQNKIYKKILNELYFINLRYEDSEVEPIDDEPVEFLEAEGRKRPKRPTNIKFNPFDDPLDFVPRYLIKGY